ncbi:MAG: hypothetical protein ACKOPO_08680 [Novosphingobium sp.]
MMLSHAAFRIWHLPVIALIIASTAAPGTAYACPPPPPPPRQAAGESDVDYRARMAKLQADMAAAVRTGISQRQARLWDESPSIFIGEVVKTRRGHAPFYGPGQSAFIRPVKWIRGAPSGKRFWLDYKSYTSCGPVGGGDAVDGKPGERFVLFAGSGALKSETVIDTIGPQSALDQRIVDALARRD